MSIIENIKRDKISFVLFTLIYVLLITFIISVNPVNDNDITSYLPIHKFIFYICCFFSVWSHIKCFLTNPGIITHEYNPHKIEFYLNIRNEAILRAIAFNERVGKKAFAGFPDDYNSDEEYTDNDDYDYPVVTSIQDDVLDKLTKKHKIQFKRCFRCYVIRYPGVRHCARCRGCIMNLDHHCPWVFNCIGQFNQKFFIQFLFYSFTGILEAGIICFYYLFIKDKKK